MVRINKKLGKTHRSHLIATVLQTLPDVILVDILTNKVRNKERNE